MDIATTVRLTVGNGKRTIVQTDVHDGLDMLYQVDPSVWSLVWAMANPDTTVIVKVAGWFTPLNDLWKVDFRDVGEEIAPTVLPLPWKLEVTLPDGETLVCDRTEALFADLTTFLEEDDG